MPAPSNLRWADGPFTLLTTPLHTTKETDPFTKCASNMCLTHNVILRGLNAIYIQAPLITQQKTAHLFSAKDRLDFLMFTHAWLDFFHVHHAGEEASLFPNIEKATGVQGIMEPNVHGHEAFKPGVHALEEYVEAQIAAGKKDKANATFDGAKICSLIDAFSAPLVEHLNDEIPTLLSLKQYGDKVPIMKYSDEEATNALGAATKTVALAYFVVNSDDEYEGGIHKGFPPVPWLPNQILRRFFVMPGKAWWRYGSTDSWGNPKELWAVQHVAQAGLSD